MVCIMKQGSWEPRGAGEGALSHRHISNTVGRMQARLVQGLPDIKGFTYYTF